MINAIDFGRDRLTNRPQITRANLVIFSHQQQVEQPRQHIIILLCCLLNIFYLSNLHF
ncbi:hypothetical protein GXM_04964 [Nostoc sphaeroides CCNUC1]|uniref:Uncharacterized protein n=1 Tax=Nostoc sphaeroides CCNUC1 TaxID=2653204 RepID=A0A5P8W4D6_9NOSO|nr:hypothetical protein GXM_04964 [Nostoc sphaeroides CCNUC1]